MTDEATHASEPGFVPWPAEEAERYRALGLWTTDTLASLLAGLAHRRAEHTAVVDARTRWTYAELYGRVLRLAAGLRGMGVRRGDAVVLQLPNRVEFVETLFALAWIGARPVMAQPAHRRFEVSHFVEKSAAVAHVVDTRGPFDFRGLAREVRRASSTLKHSILLGETDPSEAGEVSFDALHSDAVLREPAHVDAEEIALFQLSGGSTNVPKLIARTHADYLYSVRQSVEVCGWDESTTYLAVLPAAHNFTLSSPGVLGVLMAGGTLVLCESPAAGDAFALIERERVGVTALVPALVPAWLRAAARPGRALESLQTLQVGGARLERPVAERLQAELGCRLQQVFGMAEGLVCYTRADDAQEVILGSQGRPMSSHDELRVVDDDDVEVPSGQAGHLLARGPYTIRGYYDAVAHDREAFTHDGFYRTGDRVRMLPCGSVVVEGRAKDQINRGGEKIAAPEVEAQLCTHPAIELAALVAAPDPYLGERSCAFLVTSAPVTLVEVRKHLEARGLAAFKLPDRVVCVDDLPRTAVGKIDKRALHAALEAEGRAAAAGGTKEERP